MLPNEESNRQSVRTMFGKLFDAVADFLAVVSDYPACFPDGAKRKGSGVAILMTQLLCKQALIRFRSIIALCEMGHVEDADVLVRALFETVMAVRFILKPKKRVSACSSQLCAELAVLPPIPRNGTMDFRAKLYAASEPIKLDKLLRRFLTKPGMKRMTTQKHRERIADVVSDVESDIGSEWVERIRKTKSYSGIQQVRLLAEYCGLLKFWDSVYELQSGRAHGAGAVDLFYGRSTDKLPNLVGMSGEMIATILTDAQAAFRLSKNQHIEEVIASFRQMFHSVRD